MKIFRAADFGLLIAFSTFIFFVAYRFGQDSIKGLNEQQKIIYPVLLVLITTFVGFIFKKMNDVNSKIALEIKEESDKEANKKSENFLKIIRPEIERIRKQIESFKNVMGNQVYQECVDTLNKVAIAYEKYPKRRQAANEIVRWLGKQSNYNSFIGEIVDSTLKKHTIPNRILAAFYKDIGGCVKWLIDSIDRLEPQPLQNYITTQALTPDLPDGFSTYRSALELIKQQGKLKEISGESGVIEEYIDYLIQELEQL